MSERVADPLAELAAWIERARGEGAPQPAAAAFVTVGAEGQPSARTVTVKRVDSAGLVVSTALWTRKAREVEGNPRVALLFHWPAAERQAHVTGTAARVTRELELELFAERDPLHRIQTLVSRQGEPIDDLEPLRERAAHLARVEEAPPPCPPDWGALRIEPDAIELWAAAPDRIHERRLFSRKGESGWSETLLAP